MRDRSVISIGPWIIWEFRWFIFTSSRRYLCYSVTVQLASRLVHLEPFSGWLSDPSESSVACEPPEGERKLRRNTSKLSFVTSWAFLAEEREREKERERERERGERVHWWWSFFMRKHVVPSRLIGQMGFTIIGCFRQKKGQRSPPVSTASQNAAATQEESSSNPPPNTCGWKHTTVKAKLKRQQWQIERQLRQERERSCIACLSVSWMSLQRTGEGRKKENRRQYREIRKGMQTASDHRLAPAHPTQTLQGTTAERSIHSCFMLLDQRTRWHIQVTHPDPWPRTYWDNNRGQNAAKEMARMFYAIPAFPLWTL